MVSTIASRLFLTDLDKVAAIDENTSITYGHLLNQASEMAAQIGESRELVILECGASIEWLIAYVAAHLGGHPVLLVPRGATDNIRHLSQKYRASVEISVQTGYAPRHLNVEKPKLHADLSVLLLTSGSTGSPKCVRLSGENIGTNAKSISKYLNLDSTERAVVNLPVNYSYGMSVVNSHLWVGATLILTERSVIDPEFWKFCRDHSATSFVGVPHTYDLLTEIDFPDVAPKSLRYFTQAGGRLPPERTLELAEMARSKGQRFYVMYGQTEAGPRMAYLPPDQAAHHAGSIGVAVPGGILSVLNEDGQVQPPNTQGELVYEGPNVMMGYAESQEELAHGQGSRQLRTGDFARVTEDGFFYITGRMSRFVKIFGIRIGLDEVEHLCNEAGYPVIATGTDETLLVVTRQADTLNQLTEFLQTTLKLPIHTLDVRYMEDFPVSANGKVDYGSLKRSIGKDVTVDFETVQEIYKKYLGPDAEDPTLSFLDLGGDSLNFMSVALGLEDLFGTLPQNWPELSASELQAHLEQTSNVQEPQKSFSSGVLQNVDSLRAIACVLVVMFHVMGNVPAQGLHIPSNAPIRKIFELLDLVRMPLFTALAGVLFAALPVQAGGFKNILKSRLLTLIVPALGVGLISLALSVAAGKDDWSALAEIFSGYLHLWYLFSLFEIIVVVAAIDLILRPSKGSWLIILAGLYFLSVLMPWTPYIQTIKLAPFFVLGLLAYRCADIFSEKSFVTAALIVSVVGLTTQSWVLIFGGEMTSWPAPIISAAFIIVLMRFTPRLKSIEWIGLYSYAIYLWHPAANAAVRELLQQDGFQSKPILFVIGTIVGVLVPILMYRIITRFPYPVSLALIGR